MKPILRRSGELLATASILLATLWCTLPQEGIFFKWWEDHTFVLMLGLLGAGLLFFCCNVHRLMMVSWGACALLCLVLKERSQMPLQHSEKTNDALITVAHFKLPGGMSHHDENLKTILETQADLISLQEINVPLLDSLHAFFTCCGYPYFECVQDDRRQTAMVVYSRYPFHFLQAVHDPNAPGMLGKVQLSLGNTVEHFFFFSTFLNPAQDEVTYTQLRQRLRYYAHHLNEIDQPLLACGDYHLVPWSRDLQSFRTVSRLNESRRGVLPTSPHGHFSLFNHPFDHIFYSNHFKCVNFKTISSATTDYLGIVGTYQFENQDSVVHVQTKTNEL
jgi:endonuclease/exonuclease/phosphatase (EEP) superfamily protein YafD